MGGVAFTGTAFAGFASANGLALYHVPSPADAAAYSTTPAGLANFQAAFLAGSEAAALVAVPFLLIGMVASLNRARGQSVSHELPDESAASAAPPVRGAQPSEESST